MEKDRRKRLLTDEDTVVLATEIRKQMKETFFNDLGRGFWAVVWRGLIIAAIALATIDAGEKMTK
jgi:hypothetical protein